MKTAPPKDTAFLAGTAALGMLTGLVLGLLAAVCGLVVFNANPSFPRLVFGGGAIGAAIGLVYPGIAWHLIEGTVHFLFGILGVAVAEESIAPSHDAPLWLKVLLWLGVAVGLLPAFL